LGIWEFPSQVTHPRFKRLHKNPAKPWGWLQAEQSLPNAAEARGERSPTPQGAEHC